MLTVDSVLLFAVSSDVYSSISEYFYIASSTSVFLSLFMNINLLAITNVVNNNKCYNKIC